jgi:hypothetical protein
MIAEHMVEWEDQPANHHEVMAGFRAIWDFVSKDSDPGVIVEKLPPDPIAVIQSHLGMLRSDAVLATGIEDEEMVATAKAKIQVLEDILEELGRPPSISIPELHGSMLRPAVRLREIKEGLEALRKISVVGTGKTHDGDYYRTNDVQGLVKGER